ncbi:MAG TPA: tRNA lysidine(34) synthetase TilS [Gemmatimonadales bacterium]|nr:tRNA lysidine(34) synthetase TilS [Gemmatimonadales bacterium]
MTLLADFRRHLATLHVPPGRALVAVSGGPDSVALLDLLHHSRDAHRLDLVVGHFDHGIHPHSARVAAGVRQLAAAYNLAFEEGRGSLGAGAGETKARLARYAWLEETRLRLGAELIITAHHADDQAETVLMRVLSGSGPAGLAGMAAHRGSILRPLLPFRREALRRYVRARELVAWSDPANADPRHLRAWVRADLLPILRARVPRVDEALRSAARHAARERAAWNAALELFPALDFRLEPDGFSVAAPVLSGYDSSLGATLLMTASRRVGCRLGAARAARVLEVARGGVSGARAPLGEGWVAEMAFGRLTVGRIGGRPGSAWPVQGSEGGGHWGRWRFHWRRDAAPAKLERQGLTTWIAAGPVTVRAWVAGERLRPLRGNGHRLVVRCFQDARVPRGRRAVWPVLAAQEVVVWIPGVCRSDALLPAPGTEALRVDAEYS